MINNLKKIEPPFYPIVYVRGYAMQRSDIEETFYDSYYGFAASAVYKKQTQAENGYLMPDLFEGQLIRFMKSKFGNSQSTRYGYADAINSSPDDFIASNPSRSIWISRFYDVDFIQDRVRSIESHALELTDLIVNRIPQQLIALGMDPKSLKEDYKVILIAHSMGGLVCRTILQNTLPNFNKGTKKISSILDVDKIQHPENLIHRFITIGTPHKGIDLGNIPDIIENVITSSLNPYDSNIFKPTRMRQYLELGDLKNPKTKNPDEDDYKFDLHSLGKSTYPIKNCLCIIGSDYNSYSAVKFATGSFSDGLVKQDRAYMVSGEKPADGHTYGEDKTAFYANVHRAHSGYKGIVNSAETFENIHRFLFGDIKVRIAMANIKINTEIANGFEYFYDFEVAVTIQGTGVYLHQRKQDLCENAIRIKYQDLIKQKDIHLHTGFLNSMLRQSKKDGSHFMIKFNILEYRTKAGFFWDTQYPSRTIYTQSLEVRIGDDKGDPTASYSWQSDTNNWQEFQSDNQGSFIIDLNPAVSKVISHPTVEGNIIIQASGWPE